MRSACVVIGTRPEAIKLAPVVRALRAAEWETRVVSTGQHREMLDPLLRVFDVEPEVDLKVMSSSCPAAAVLEGMTHVLAGWKPDVLIVQGDTTSAALAGLAGFYERIPVAHVEAGLRTYDRDQPFPEELNRQILGRVANVHFAPTSRAADNLICEGTPSTRVHVTGNTSIDALHWLVRDLVPTNPGVKQILVTFHRREHYEDFGQVCEALLELASRPDVRIVFPVHRNPQVRAATEQLVGNSRITLLDPLDYPEFIQVFSSSFLVITDSGGIQEEASVLGKPVLITRNVTERAELVAAGGALLVGCDKEKIVGTAVRLLDDALLYTKMAQPRELFGDGRAAERIVELLSALPL